ncbi:MAG: hypothetical protein H6Q00_1962 [Holophagaceae bacterium]|nr:hypothetical protein [Holophagaceae bacterium]
MSKVRNIGTCIGIGGGITAFILCTLAGFTPMIQWLWVGFLSMIIYFATGSHKSFSMAGKMILSFLCGLIWGQLSNLIWFYVFPVNPVLTAFLDFGVLVGLLLWVHLSLLVKTPFGFVPTVFLGLAMTIAFFGRPFPFQGHGLMGSLPPIKGVGLLIAYVVFGLLFSFMIEYIAGALAPKIIRQEPQQ